VPAWQVGKHIPFTLGCDDWQAAQVAGVESSAQRAFANEAQSASFEHTIVQVVQVQDKVDEHVSVRSQERNQFVLLPAFGSG
jgi:hypothetical protein